MSHKHIYRYKGHKTIGVDFSAGRFLRRYSFIYLLQFSIPIRYYAMAIQCEKKREGCREIRSVNWYSIPTPIRAPGLNLEWSEFSPI